MIIKINSLISLINNGNRKTDLGNADSMFDWSKDCSALFHSSLTTLLSPPEWWYTGMLVAYDLVRIYCY